MIRFEQSTPTIAQLISEISRISGKSEGINCKLTTGIGKLWSTLRSPFNHNRKYDRIVIKFANKTITNSKECSGTEN